MNKAAIDTKFLQARYEALKKDAGDRNEKMDKFERMYRLDPWEGPQPPNRTRVALPTAFDMVEKFRALLMTRPPTISYPPVDVSGEAQAAAQKIERYLYGVSHKANLERVVADADWYANCLGVGAVKTMYDRHATDDDFPISFVAPDPRSLFWRASAGKDRAVELVHAWDRPRREIEDEWPIKLARPHAMDSAQLEAWLDVPVCYVEYWTETQAWEDVGPKEEEPKLLSDLVGEAMLASMGVEKEDEAEDETPVTRRRVRKIVHAVAVLDGQDGVMIKKASVMPGYKRIPFAFWPGISTPLAGASANLSILYPLSNGDGGKKSVGILAAENMLMSIDLESALTAPNAPLYVTDPNGEPLDMSPGAQNFVAPGTEVGRIQTDTVNPAVLRMSQVLRQQVQRVGVPEVMSGQVYQLSGAAVSGMASSFQMIIGFKQRERERAYQQILENVLDITREYADEGDGWTAYGLGADGNYVEAQIKPSDITACRVIVRLSASMPRDEIGIANALSNFQRSGQIGLETFLDQFQKLFGLAADTPKDEIVRILRDKALMAGPIAEQIANKLAQEYVNGVGIITSQDEQRAQSMLFQPPPPPQMTGGNPNEGLG